MTRFWTFVTIILITGIIAAFIPQQQQGIRINDLETECRENNQSTTNIGLDSKNSITFEGRFPVTNIQSELSYDYNKNGRLVLNVKSENLPPPESLWDTCLASAVYDIQTTSLEPGSYDVEVRHNNERIERRIIRIRG